MLEYWQALLALRDWRIEIETITSAHDAPELLGECIIHAEERNAVIRLRDIDDTHTLVHELLHVVFWRWQAFNDDADEVLFEQGINAITDALLLRGCDD